MELLNRTIAIFGMEHPATIKVAQLLEEGEYDLALDAFYKQGHKRKSTKWTKRTDQAAGPLVCPGARSKKSKKITENT